jgi:hypothetical protein
MSCEQNEKIWEAVYEKAEAEGLYPEVFAEMDLEYCYEYLITGEIPECYDRIAYRMYKT